jgi:hypothetical protein
MIAMLLAGLGRPAIALADNNPSATGGASILVDQNYGGGYGGDVLAIRIEFSAVTHKDGTVTGEFHYEDSDGVVVHGVVDGLEIDNGNDALISGYVTDSNTPDIVVLDAFSFEAVDNGEGANAANPDMLSIPNSGRHHHRRHEDLYPILDGNIQVRP